MSHAEFQCCSPVDRSITFISVLLLLIYFFFFDRRVACTFDGEDRLKNREPKAKWRGPHRVGANPHLEYFTGMLSYFPIFALLIIIIIIFPAC